MVLFDLKSSTLREVSVSPLGPRAVLFRLAKFLLETLNLIIQTNYYIEIITVIRNTIIFPFSILYNIMNGNTHGHLIFKNH